MRFHTSQTLTGRRSARLTLSKDEAAKELGISVRHLERLVSQGAVPPPLRMGRRVRFGRDALANWVNAMSQRTDVPSGASQNSSSHCREAQHHAPGSNKPTVPLPAGGTA
ncbi:helix-turn-helix transcriptional regulator [Phycisphaerales bacterium AB-hyl4]|uniref:Helix-turn-helix transcriptional regulator n=1 Tax=Natronomicrosphaera hydrolytica TaxID=3242702 RepID=A0ABV4U831_9BACT